MFHSQNHAVVHSESMTGQEITAENTANAPLEMRIYGASRQEQSTQGKNLLDPYRLLPSNAATTIAIDDNVITVTSTWYASIVVNVEKNSSYTIQCGITGSANTVPLRVTDTAETGRLAVLTETLQTATFNTAELEQVKVWLYSGNGTEQTATFTNLQLEEGTIGTAYEPFTPNSPSPDYPSEIKSAVDFEAGSTGKNLLYNKKAKSLNSSGLTFAVSCDGSITVNGVSTSPYGYRLGGGWNNADPVLYLQPGEYTMTTGPERLPPNCILSIFKAVNQSVAMCSDVRPITQFALTEETGITDINFATNVAGARYDNITIYPAIYKGSYTASTLPAYTPYVPPCQAAVNLPLRGIPDSSGGWAARDYIEVKDGIVRLVRECGEIAFDGTEVWHDYIATFDTVSHRLPHKHPVPALCTHGRYGGRYKGIFFGWASVDDIGFYPSRIGVDSVAGWKAWLAAQNTAGSPVKVVYALDVAQVTDITSTELGQALSGMKSVQYYTRIYHTSALPVEMAATILKLGR